MEVKFLLASEAARALNVAASTIRRWESSGALRASRTLGGTRVFSADDVRKLAAERERQRADRE